VSTEPSSEFVRGPKWRTRTSPRRRHCVAALTFALVVAVGLAVTLGFMRLLSWADAPGWVVAMPWWLPTVGTLVWTLARPTVSGLSDDDDDSWLGYSIRWVLVGELDPRPAPVRVIAAILFGAPVVWALVIAGVLTVAGIL
jgi:hypothetical protein